MSTVPQKSTARELLSPSKVYTGAQLPYTVRHGGSDPVYCQTRGLSFSALIFMGFQLPGTARQGFSAPLNYQTRMVSAAVHVQFLSLSSHLIFLFYFSLYKIVLFIVLFYLSKLIYDEICLSRILLRSASAMDWY